MTDFSYNLEKILKIEQVKDIEIIMEKVLSDNILLEEIQVNIEKEGEQTTKQVIRKSLEKKLKNILSEQTLGDLETFIYETGSGGPRKTL